MLEKVLSLELTQMLPREPYGEAFGPSSQLISCREEDRKDRCKLPASNLVSFVKNA
jgi:hypothetical protein